MRENFIHKFHFFAIFEMSTGVADIYEHVHKQNYRGKYRLRIKQNTLKDPPDWVLPVSSIN